MFKIKWRKRVECDKYRRILPVVTGLSRYATRETAAAQVAIFQSVFPQNHYYIEPA